MWHLLVFSLCVQKCISYRYETTSDKSYQLVGIFNRESITQQAAFNESFNHVNFKETRIQPIILQPLRTDSYSVWRDVCSNKLLQPVAIFGPQSPITDGAIRDQCAKANIPHIQATWQPMDPDLEEESSPDVQDEEEPQFKPITINFYPNSDEILLAYGKLLKYYQWESFAALYEDNFGLLRVQKIIAEVSAKSRISLYKLDPDEDNRKTLKQLVEHQDRRILLDCHADRIQKYMNEAALLKLVDEYQHFIIVSMDTSTVADKLVAFHSNTTWLSLADYEQINDGKHYLAARVGKWNAGESTKLSSVTDFEIEALMMDDVSTHVVKALKNLEGFEPPQEFDCTNEEGIWPDGARLQNEILKTQSFGVTGNIQFNEQGQRINYTLYVNEIKGRKRLTIGIWDSSNSSDIIVTRPESDERNSQASKHFIIISRRAKPYFYEKTPVVCEEGDTECEEDEDPDIPYEGFSVDLVKKIFQILKEENFNYTYEFTNATDNSYGTLNPKTNKWSGLIGDLLDKRADLAVCDLTITEERKKVIDFSVPIMTLGISILFTKEKKQAPGIFSFLYPYTVDVWMYTATAYCIVSIILFICARISPADWENPEPCEKDPEELENTWTFKNCAWLTMGSIMTQGCDILPKAVGTRWVCGMWWFFAVIVCQTYIAQLSASMTSAMEDEPINSVDDLAKQTKILYGAINGGSTLDFFKSSKDKTYQQMYQNMISNPAVLVNTNDEGEKRVVRAKNKYAFFMESCTIEYKLKRKCILKKVGGELDSKDYGIGMPTNSPYRTHINRAILKLKELTALDGIKNKWWDQKYDAKECKEETDENDLEGDLEMENLIGAFVVLLVGLGFALLITAVEFMNEVRNIVVREQVTHKEVFIKELKASLNFTKLQKPVLRNPSRAPSVVSSDSDDRVQQKSTISAIDNFIGMEKQVQ